MKKESNCKLMLHNGCTSLKINSLMIFFMSILFIISAIISCTPMAKQVFDFDDGTTQNWNITPVYDDQGKTYTPLFKLTHTGNNTNIGSLGINLGQFGPWAKTSGFPEKSSQYWEVIVYNRWLSHKPESLESKAWQGIKGVQVSLKDECGMGTDPILVNILIRCTVGNQSQDIAEVDSQGKPLFHPISHAKWSTIKANLNIPTNTVVDQVWIKFRANLKPGLYEGSLLVDNVKPIK